MKNNKGITLIALIVTIIILIILAGITITSIKGDESTIKQAQDANDQAEEMSERTTVGMVSTNTLRKYGKIEKEKLEEELNKYLDGDDIAKVNAGLVITFTKSGRKYQVKGDGSFTNTVELPETAEGQKAGTAIKNPDSYGSNAQATADGAGKFFPLPTGAIYKEGTVDTGVVIELAESEFVWVPVANINDMAQCSTAGGSCTLAYDKTAKELTCTEHNKGQNEIVGKLYATSTEENFKPSANTSYSEDSGIREPALVEDYDKDENKNTYLAAAGYSTSTEMLLDMKIEYYNMAKSVAEYRGFYVGRYESSIDESTIASKKGVTSMTEATSSGNMWYGMYNKQKGFAEAKGISNKVGSQMIWGSQYDAMMNWMKDQGIPVTSKSIPGKINNTTRKTGEANQGQTESTDVLNNIYDLLGNSFEWTQEADNTYSRVHRGGWYYIKISPSYRDDEMPRSDGTGIGSRVTLYIK